jgi:hypothetical protein
MPLPPPATGRTPHHTRTITCQGFQRDDGLWDIDGWITDVKFQAFGNWDRGEVPAGEPIHGMGLRMTVDEKMVIHDLVAVTDFSPYSICPNVTPNFRKLIGLTLAKGFKKSVQEILGGTHGCVHLVDLLGPVATTAYQTIGFRKKHSPLAQNADGETVKPGFINTCHTWSTDGPIVKKEFPAFYTGR